MRPARWLISGALALAALGPALAAVPAFADSAVSSVLASNWYWQEQDNVTPPGAPVGLPAGAPAPASGVPAGDLGVAYTNQVDKVTALNFDLSSLKAGASVSAFTVTMPLDSAAHNIASPSAPPTLSACPAIDSFTPAPGPSPFRQVPPQGTSVCVEGRYDAGHSAYVFDLAAMASDWAAGAPRDGVVIQPKPGDNTQFNYAFKGPKDIAVALSFHAAAPAAPVVSPAPAPAAGSGAGPAPAPAPPAGFGTAALPAAPLTSGAAPPLTAPAPQVMTPPPPAPALAAGPVAPAAASTSAPALDALRPDGLFWLSLLGLAGLLLLAALVLGDPLAPVAADPRRRRFAQAVRARAAATAATGSRSPLARARPV